MKRMVCAGVIAMAAMVAACGDNAPDPDATQIYSFGPYTLPAGMEVTDQCVQITLHNDTDLFINQVELTTGAGFHHSNWFFVPEHIFTGPGDSPDGTFTCTDRDFSEPAAALFGGVLFAQSTQSPHEIQGFPEGVAVHVPAHSKLVAQIHLLNPSETDDHLSPTIAITPIAKSEVTTQLAAISFEDHALGLPPRAQSSFGLDCDLSTTSQRLTGADPDFKLYYALAHYHVLGTGMTVEAVKADGTSTMVFDTTNRIGDSLGGVIDPQFDMAGYTRLRVTCDYYNDRDATVGWGVGDQEMCVFLAFSDSPYDWGGGATDATDLPGDPTDVDGVQSFSHACSVYAEDAAR